MRTRLTTVLDSPKKLAWQAEQTTRLLDFIAGPFLRFELLQPAILPERWNEGNFLVRTKIIG